MAATITVQTGNVALPKLSVSVAQDSVYAALAQLISVDNPDETVDEYDTTNTDITDNYKTSKGGWITPGEWGFSFNFTEALWSQIIAIGNGITANWLMSWSDPGHTSTDPMDEWTGFIKTSKKNQPIDDRHTIDIVIKVTGAVTFTEGT